MTPETDFLDGDKLGNPVGKVKEAVLTGFSGAVGGGGGGDGGRFDDDDEDEVEELDKDVVRTGDAGG